MMIARASSRRRDVNRSTRRQFMLGLLFVSPWLLGFIAFGVFPVISSLYYSFQQYDLLTPPVYIGLANYAELFSRGSDFGTVAYNTAYFVILGAPAGVASAFLIATLLNTEIKGRSVFRTIYFIPSIVPAVVTAEVWKFLLDPQYGAFNATLRSLGFPIIPFISNAKLAKPSLILIHMWAQGSAMVIFLASLQDVPRSLYEAAIVDGANAWQKFWHITIPMCSPVILFNLIMAFIGGFQNFTLPWLLTGGGPEKATEFYAIYLYRNAFFFMRMGKASALAWILFIVIVLFTIALFRSSARWVYYAGER